MAEFRKAKITSRLVASLKQGETVMDTDLPGYGVRRQKGEPRTYFVRKAHYGARHYITIGEEGVAGCTEAKARSEALQIIAAIKKGDDPTAARVKAKAMPKLVDWAETVLAEREGVVKKGTMRNYRCFLRCHIAPRGDDNKLRPDCLGKLKLDVVTRTHVTALHRKLGHAPRVANQVLTLISVLFSEAQKAGYIPKTAENPAKDIMRYPERKRERFLTEEEISRLGEVLAAVEADESEDIYAIAAIRLLLLTGCRLDEILSARREWIDFQRSMLNLPDSKTGQKVVHLNGAALEVLRAIPCIEGNPYIIVGRIEGGHWVNLNKVWKRIRTKAGILPTTLANGKVEHVRIHDLRHSFASLTAATGASLIMIGKLLGHKNPRTTARYAHLVDDHVKRVNNEVGDRVGAAFNLRPVAVS